MFRQFPNYVLAAFLVVVLALGIGGCKKKGASKGPGEEDQTSMTAVPTPEPTPMVKPYSSEIDDATEMYPHDITKAEVANVYFDYDKYALTFEAREILATNAIFLKKNKSVMVQIEGHCDERGTIEYNLALGQKRAESTREYLIQMGIDSSRITTISYGEERPADPGENEAAWAKNRRAEFVITSR